MPRQDGYETARQIRKRWSEGRTARLIAMTANVSGDREMPRGRQMVYVNPSDCGRWKARWNVEGPLRGGNAAQESSTAKPETPGAACQTGSSTEAAGRDDQLDEFHEEMLGDDDDATVIIPESLLFASVGIVGETRSRSQIRTTEVNAGAQNRAPAPRCESTPRCVRWLNWNGRPIWGTCRDWADWPK